MLTFVSIVFEAVYYIRTCIKFALVSKIQKMRPGQRVNLAGCKLVYKICADMWNPFYFMKYTLINEIWSNP